MHDVLISGCGPVGAVLANLLGKDGVDVLVLDEAAAIYDKPRAVNIDHEVLRAGQAIGLADVLTAETIPHTGTDFIGADGTLIKVLNSLPPPYPMAWPPNLMFVQPPFEAALRGGMARYDCVELRTGRRLLDVAQTEERIRARIETLETGAVEEVEARYLVACDGAASSVRKGLRISQTSLNFDEWYVVVDAILRRETRLPARTTHFCRPTGPGAYVVCPGPLRRFEMKILPGENPQAFQDPEVVRAKLSHFVDVDAVDLWRSAAYRFHALVADRWRVGRILLAGDAAHQMPPHMGQGLCSGVRDAVNLSWKLKMVLDGQCGENLLDTYEAERRPHITALVALSKDIAALTGELDPVRAAERDTRLRAEMESGASETVRQRLIPGLVGGVVDPGRSPLSGELSVQPRIEDASGGDGILLDDLVGECFTLIGLDVDLLDFVAAGDRAVLEEIGARFLTIATRPASERAGEVLCEQGSLFAAWMGANGVRMVVIRPDKYVFGSASDVAGGKRLVDALVAALGLRAGTDPAVRGSVVSA